MKKYLIYILVGVLSLCAGYIVGINVNHLNPYYVYGGAAFACLLIAYICYMTDNLMDEYQDTVERLEELKNDDINITLNGGSK